jgi:hypothetical protein
MDFIFMLTRQDRTVEDCLLVAEELADVGLRHVGFKDVGVPRPVLDRLHERLRGLGFTTYLEVVSTSPAAALTSARVAVELGVDTLMGGTQVGETLAITAGTGVAYLPFVGRPEGHPTTLGGTASDIAADCAAVERAGCAGADLLAFRATDDEPIALVRAARAHLSGRLVVAGNIDSPERVAAVAGAGADAFTVGSAVFDGSFSPWAGSLRARLADILSVTT